MFCNKCGKELPDNASFCSGCGNQVGAAPAAAAAPAAPAQLPPILSRFGQQFVGFFTKKNPVGVVAGSAKDTTFSGAILILISAIISSLACMVNFNQFYLFLFKSLTKADGQMWSYMKKALAKTFPSGATFGMSLLATVVIAIASIAMVYVVVNVIAKKQMHISGIINIVAYSSIPLVCAFTVNMLAGLIWAPLTIVFTAIAVVATLVLLYASIQKACGYQDNAFLPYMIAGIVITIVAILFTYLWIKAGFGKIGDSIGDAFGGFL